MAGNGKTIRFQTGSESAIERNLKEAETTLVPVTKEASAEIAHVPDTIRLNTVELAEGLQASSPPKSRPTK